MGGLSNFVFFPWAGFVFAGAIVGLVLDGLRTRRQEHLANLGFALVGTGLTVAAYELSFFPDVVSAVAFLDDVAGVLLHPRWAS